MGIILFNVSWMALNISLAVLAIAFGFIFLNLKNAYLKFLFFILWLIFIPNTIYLITDLQYLPEQFLEIENSYKALLVLQHLTLFCLGIIFFYIGLYPLDKMLSKKLKDKMFRNLIIILIIYLIAFGVALGRIQRTNSWDIVFNFSKVLENSLTLINSKLVLASVFIFGTLSLLLYFSLKRLLKKII